MRRQLGEPNRRSFRSVFIEHEAQLFGLAALSGFGRQGLPDPFFAGALGASRLNGTP
jgi:hypothetical protein